MLDPTSLRAARAGCLYVLWAWFLAELLVWDSKYWHTSIPCLCPCPPAQHCRSGSDPSGHPQSPSLPQAGLQSQPAPNPGPVSPPREQEQTACTEEINTQGWSQQFVSVDTNPSRQNRLPQHKQSPALPFNFTFYRRLGFFSAQRREGSYELFSWVLNIKLTKIFFFLA